MSGPHDALFKYVFSQPEHTAAELRSVLPAELSERVDWGSLELQPSTFVDEHLSERQADLLFTVRCDGKQAFLYVLLEHQSSNDSLMGFRLLRYIVRIRDAFLRQNSDARRLPAIIPVVLHHSAAGWVAARDLHSLIDLDAQTLALVAPHIPQFSFILDDLSLADDEALRGRSLTAVATAGLVLLAKARGAPRLIDELERWLDVLSEVARAPNGFEASVALMRYASQVGDNVRPEELRDLALRIGPVAHEAYMTVAQILTAEVFARAKAEGKAEGKAELLLRLLTVRFGDLSEATRQRVLEAPPDCLDVWAERVITVGTLDEVLR